MDTRTAILDAAEIALRSHGQNGFSYHDLSKVVGIRTASIHYHFPSKTDLIITLIQRYTRRVQEEFERLEVGPKTAGQRLDAFIDINRGALEDGHCLCLCVALLLAPDDLNQAARDELLAFRTDELAWLGRCFALGAKDGTIRDCASPEIEAAACLALVEGAQLAARAATDVGWFDRAIAPLKARITG